jgi:hypothetical protein
MQMSRERPQAVFLGAADPSTGRQGRTARRDILARLRRHVSDRLVEQPSAQGVARPQKRHQRHQRHRDAVSAERFS